MKLPPTKSLEAMPLREMEKEGEEDVKSVLEERWPANLLTAAIALKTSQSHLQNFMPTAQIYLLPVRLSAIKAHMRILGFHKIKNYNKNYFKKIKNWILTSVIP